MSLKDEVLGVSQRKLTVDRIIDTLEEDDRKDLLELLADNSIEGSAIALVLRRRNFDISDRTIQRYRKHMEENLDG